MTKSRVLHNGNKVVRKGLKETQRVSFWSHLGDFESIDLNSVPSWGKHFPGSTVLREGCQIWSVVLPPPKMDMCCEWWVYNMGGWLWCVISSGSIVYVRWRLSIVKCWVSPLPWKLITQKLFTLMRRIIFNSMMSSWHRIPLKWLMRGKGMSPAKTVISKFLYIIDELSLECVNVFEETDNKFSRMERHTRSYFALRFYVKITIVKNGGSCGTCW